jgi:hypothetical protein
MVYPQDCTAVAFGNLDIGTGTASTNPTGGIVSGTTMGQTPLGLSVQPVTAGGAKTPQSYSFTETTFLVENGAHLAVTSGDLFVGGKATVVGRLDPSTLEPSDRNGGPNPIPTGGPGGSQGITFDSTKDALRPRWKDPAGVENSLALLTDLGGGGPSTVLPCHEQTLAADLTIGATETCATFNGLTIALGVTLTIALGGKLSAL